MAKTAQGQSLLAVDDDTEVLRQITRSLESRFAVRTTSSWAQATAWLQMDKTIKLLMVGQVLRSGMGVDLLENARRIRPDVRRVLLTNFADMTGLIQGLHSGTIDRTIGTSSLHGELMALMGASVPVAHAAK
jgi:thioredoxin reductase (NADPH)